MTLKKYSLLFIILVLVGVISCEQEYVVVQEKPDDIILVDTIYTSDTNRINITKIDTSFKWQSSRTAEAVDDAVLVEVLTSDSKYSSRGRSDFLWTFAWTNNADGEPSYDSRSLIKFNELDLLDENITIDSAFLTLFAYKPVPFTPFGGPYGANQIRIHRALEMWEENKVNWANQPHFNSLDYIETSNILSTQDSLVIEVSDHVKGQIETTNYGLLIKNWNEEAPLSSVRFYSSDIADKTLCPYLTVYYHEE